MHSLLALDDWLRTIDFWQPAPQLLLALQRGEALSDAHVAELASGKYIKSWQAGIVLRALPLERLIPHAETLLGHLQDSNWPAFPDVAEVVRAMGTAAIPAIQHVFQTDPRDGDWMERILWSVVDYWEDDCVQQLQPTLIAYVHFAERGGASIAALETLERVLLPDKHVALYQELRTLYADSAELTTKLQQAFQY
ncbi:hypothetical protein GCM10022409_29520 [Hymenobacter glaciei]|uniref:DUF5071 domain-containing protein n=1 Tax=Hymenobacter glaciei TaxID=877209 RepID=A0ABP7UF00_9BACT